MNSTVLDTAKVFKTGRSQAVRLPKAYRFDTDEVTIERQGDAVILRPVLPQDLWWQRMEAAMDGLRGAIEPIERDRVPLRDDIPSFD